MSHLQSATFKNKTTNQTGKQVLVCLYALRCCYKNIEGCFVYMDHPLYNSEGRLTVDVKEEEISKSLKIK